MLEDKKKQAIAHALKYVRKAFREAMQDVKAEVIQSTQDENDLPKIREDFNAFTQTVAEALKSFDLHKHDNQVVTASVEKGTVADLLEVALETFQKGHEEEAKSLFTYAAFNTQDIHLDNMPNTLLMRNLCQSCGAPLPPVANFCPICGTKLNNEIDQQGNNLQLQPENPNAVPVTTIIPSVPQTYTPNPQVPANQPQIQMPLSIPSLPPILMTSIQALHDAGKFEEAASLIISTLEEDNIAFDKD